MNTTTESTGSTESTGHSVQNPLLQPGLDGAYVRDGFGALPAAYAGKLAEKLAARASASTAPLAGRTLAVKDVFDIEGLRTGGGNPLWAAQQPLAAHTAPPVRVLLEAGAQWTGKTVTDELTYSLAGINAHYGTPRNPADPQRVPGGSSSGSVVAVAAGHADIGLGTDCGGSIRLPASYCGIWGIRPTHGRIAANGCFTLAHSFDTVGWFTRDGALLAQVFALLAQSEVAPLPERVTLCIPDDIVPLLQGQVRGAFAGAVAALSERFTTNLLASGSLAPHKWGQSFRILQGAEIAQQHGAWAQQHLDSFGADVGARMQAAAAITPAQVHAEQRTRSEAIRRLAAIFDDAPTYLVMPTLPWIAPRIDASRDEVDDVRTRSLQMLCIAGLAGLPQVNLPWLTFEGAPLGMSIVGARGDDENVLAVARAVHDTLASAAV
jgi:amidase